jgi:uncharacterized protein with GYD domain
VIEEQCAGFVSQYSSLGRYEFVYVVVAKDAETMARVSVSLGARGTLSIETLSAIPVESFIRSISAKKSAR